MWFSEIIIKTLVPYLYNLLSLNSFSKNISIEISSKILSTLSDFVTILSIYGIYRLWKDYKIAQDEIKIKQKNQTIQAIRALKFQLELMKDWTGFNGVGYINDEEVKKTWNTSSFPSRGNPFSFVIPIENSPLKQIHLLPGIQYLSSDILEAISSVNQLLVAYTTLLDEIRLFKYSWDSIKLIHLAKKFENNKISDLDDDERLFVERLMSFQTTLHFNIIGSDKNKGLHYWHKRLFNLLNDLENNC